MATAVFPLVPRRRVVGLAFGGVRSVRRGVGSDVASTREYRPGDDVAWMDWAASARLSAARGSDEFIVRERFADEAPRVVVLADRRPPRSEMRAEHGAFDERPFAAPTDTVSLGLEFLGEHRRDLPTQAFVFVLSDFIVPPNLEVRQRPLQHRWEL